MLEAFLFLLPSEIIETKRKRFVKRCETCNGIIIITTLVWNTQCTAKIIDAHYAFDGVIDRVNL